ncbi:MAG: CsgG/HfaB family protein [Thermoanaerobaculia bacterium]
MRLRLSLLFFALLLDSGVACASDPRGMVLLPLDNISGAPDAPKLVRAALVQRLQMRGWKVLEGEDVERVLERNRVRYMDSVTDGVRRELVEATGARAVMMASISTFRGGDAAVVTLSARLIGADGRLLWSNIGGAHASQTERMFGGVRPTGPEDVSREAVDSLTSSLPRPDDPPVVSLPRGAWFRQGPAASFVARELGRDKKPRICVLPFDSNSQSPEAALIVANTFSVRLAQTGDFDVVEAAELRAATVKARIGSFNALSSDELAKLGDIVGAPLFLRGTISRYVDSSGSRDTVVPEVEIDLFLVDVKAGSVLWSASHSRTGNDYVGFLMLGAIFDAATLTDRTVCEFAASEHDGVRRNAHASAQRHDAKPERRELLAATARKDQQQ